MSSSIIKGLLSFSLMVISLAVLSQEKREQETNVKKEDVPETAVEWVQDAFDRKGKVKWYYEISDQGNSYEAKFKSKKERYSVKFDTTGQIIDIEVQADFREIVEPTREKILSFFTENYSAYNIMKVQFQYTGESDDLFEIIEEKEKDDFEELEDEDVTLRYEIEYRGKTSDYDKLWEGLFDQQGNLIQKKEIILPANFNVEY